MLFFFHKYTISTKIWWLIISCKKTKRKATFAEKLFLRSHNNIYLFRYYYLYRNDIDMDIDMCPFRYSSPSGRGTQLIISEGNGRLTFVILTVRRVLKFKSMKSNLQIHEIMGNLVPADLLHYKQYILFKIWPSLKNRFSWVAYDAFSFIRLMLHYK